MSDEPPEFRYFLDYDEEEDALNVFAAVTNYGLYVHGSDRTYYTGEAGEPVSKTGNTPMEGYGATFSQDNSGVSWYGASREALGPEIPEGAARKIHPQLFERMNRDEQNTRTPNQHPYRGNDMDHVHEALRDLGSALEHLYEAKNSGAEVSLSDCRNRVNRAIQEVSQYQQRHHAKDADGDVSRRASVESGAA